MRYVCAQCGAPGLPDDVTAIDSRYTTGRCSGSHVGVQYLVRENEEFTEKKRPVKVDQMPLPERPPLVPLLPRGTNYHGPTGRIIARYDIDQNGVVIVKPQPLRHEHVMSQTGAPGWDKAMVDELLGGGPGTLVFQFDGIEYAIDAQTFRDRAFVRDFGWGEQYHVQRSHYTAR